MFRFLAFCLIVAQVNADVKHVQFQKTPIQPGSPTTWTEMANNVGAVIGGASLIISVIVTMYACGAFAFIALPVLVLCFVFIIIFSRVIVIKIG